MENYNDSMVCNIFNYVFKEYLMVFKMSLYSTF